MLRRQKIFLILTFLGLLGLYRWYNARVTRFTRTGKREIINNSIRLPHMNKSVLQTSIHIPPRRTVLYKLSGRGRLQSKPAIVFRSFLSPGKPRVNRLPKLTQAAQDAYYGKGCKRNPYRRRLQILLDKWRKIVKRRAIKGYFLCFGSLLGSVRNKDMIPYDSDIDICMLRDEYHKLYPEESKRPVNLNDGKIHMLLQRHSPRPKDNTPRKDCEGYVVRKQVDDCAILDPPARFYLGAYIYLDIFIVDDLGTKLWDEYHDKIHDRGLIFPLKPCTFLGLDTRCPNDTKGYLKAYYGARYMKPHHVCKHGKWVKNRPDARPRLL